MTVDARLRRHLRRWSRRLRFTEGVSWVVWGGLAGLGAGILLAGLARLMPLLTQVRLALFSLLLIATGAGAGLVAAWLRPRSIPRLARIFDGRFALAERLVTATEIGRENLSAPPAMAAAQLDDTLARARRVDVRSMLPIRLSRRALWTLVGGSVILALLIGLPNPQEAVLRRRAAVEAAIEAQAETLEAIQEDVLEVDSLTEVEREALLQALAEALAELESGDPSPEEALATLSEAERSLAELRDSGVASLETGLERAAGTMADSSLTREIAEALGAGDYDRAAEALAAFGGQEGDALTRDEELALARELAQAAERIAEGAPEMAEALSEAAETIQERDIQAAQEAIQQAAQAMSEAGQQIESQAFVEAAQAELQAGREQIGEAAGVSPGSGPGTLPGGQLSGGSGGDGAGSGQQTQPGHSEDAGTGAPYDELYVPERIDEPGTGVDVGREGEDGLPAGDAPLPAPPTGRPNVPYEEVYADYAEQAGAALEDSYIPLGMKQYVRDYFSALEP